MRSPAPCSVRLGPWLLLSLLLAAPLTAVPPKNVDVEVPMRTGTAQLDVGGRQQTIPFSLVRSGPMVAVQPLVALLGGELTVGPLGQSHTLTMQDVTAIFGAGSSIVLIDEEMVPLPSAPQAGNGGLHVPLALAERTWGDLLGYEFVWDAATPALTVTRRPPRHLELGLDVVHLQGVTTLVFEFPVTPHYRIHRGPGRVEVELAGDQVSLAAQRPLPAGSLVRGLRVAEHRIRLDLARGTEASDYVLAQPFRLVFDVHPERRAPEIDLDPGQATARSGIHTIVIDPGHGGSESGAIGASGVAEKDLSLGIARALRSRLQSRLPVRVVMTREGDSDLPLESRAALANQHKADLFISLHLNSSVGSTAHGAETYFLSLQASDERAAEVAAIENVGRAVSRGTPAADPLHELQLMLWDLAQSHYLGESQRLANLIQEELNQALGLRDRGVKQAPLAVLRGAAMPAVLVELGFLSNPDEEAKLQRAGYQEELVDALVRAVARYRAVTDPAADPGEQQALR